MCLSGVAQALCSLVGLEDLGGGKKGEPNISCLSERKGVTLPVVQGPAYPSFTRITLHFLCFEIDVKTAVKKGDEYIINDS